MSVFRIKTRKQLFCIHSDCLLVCFILVLFVLRAPIMKAEQIHSLPSLIVSDLDLLLRNARVSA